MVINEAHRHTNRRMANDLYFGWSLEFYNSLRNYCEQLFNELKIPLKKNSE